MRRHILIVLGIVLFACHGLGAQNASCHFGLYGGFTANNFSSLRTPSGKEIEGNPLMGGKVGLNLHIKLPAYFSLSPAVEYGVVNLDVAAADLHYGDHGDVARVQQHLVSVPVPLSWGPDLGIIRPFVQVVPFVNFSVGGRFRTADNIWNDAKEMLALAQFGVGAGGGIEIWKIIVSARYNWMLGAWNEVREPDTNPFTRLKGRRSGVTVTIGINF